MTSPIEDASGLVSGISRGIALVILAIHIVGPAQAETDRERTRTAMRAIYGQIEALLPLSVDEQSFRSADSRAQIMLALATLASKTSELGNHASDLTLPMAFLANSLSREAEGTRDRFESGQTETARFFVQRLTDYCVACHSRLPSPVDSALATGFLDAGELAKQPLARRAELQIATRQFDDALDSFESLFASPTRHTAEFLEPVSQYLRLAVGVKGDFARPISTLRLLSSRKDLSDDMRKDIESWTRSLERHAAKPPGTPSLELARGVLADAADATRGPHDRRALVEDLLAASLLQRFLEARPESSSRDLAEAYYLLGLIESRTHTQYRFFECEFYLETAIRIAPEDPIARAAFDLLEQQTVLGWVGSGGNNMPAPIQQNLERLRALVYPDSDGRGERGGGLR